MIKLFSFHHAYSDDVHWQANADKSIIPQSTKPWVRSLRDSKFAWILWMLDSAFRLTNYILFFTHWEFLISFKKVLKLRILSNFRISWIPRIIILWFETNTKARSDACRDLLKKNSGSSTTSSSWKFQKLILGFNLSYLKLKILMNSIIFLLKSQSEILKTFNMESGSSIDSTTVYNQLNQLFHVYKTA